jgi:type IV pilus assembly protein PilV
MINATNCVQRRHWLDRSHRQSGVTMIEVLIAVVVVSIGLLGMAALQGVSIQTNQSASLRSKAVLLSSEIIESIRANANRVQYVDVAVPPAPPSMVTQFVDQRPDYEREYEDAAPSTLTTQAQRDLAGWLERVGEALPQGDGRVEVNGASVTVGIRWNDQRFAERFGITGTDAELTEFVYEIEI